MTPLTNEEWRARQPAKKLNKSAGGTLTLAQVREMTERDVLEAKLNPVFEPSEIEQSRVLCERLLTVSTPISPESLNYARELQARGWISASTWSRVLKETVTDFDDWRDSTLRRR